MTTVKPNFFIVGAPKCGTTALYEYLRPHPRICMPSAKEPHFFSTDLHPNRVDYVKQLEEYLGLFRRCDSRHSAVGEASVGYLYSSVAIEAIHAFDPSARLIVLLRDPVEVTHAMHAQNLLNFDEDREVFEEAWELQEARAAGRKIPPRCRNPLWLQYRAIGRLGEQVERLLSVFPREQVLFIFFEDFVGSTRAVYEEVLAFLGVPSDGRTEFPRVNPNKVYRWPWLIYLYKRPPRPVLLAVRTLKRWLGLHRVNLLWKTLMVVGSRPAERRALPEELERQLRREFSADVRRLSRLLDRDLARWLPD